MPPSSTVFFADNKSRDSDSTLPPVATCLQDRRQRGRAIGCDRPSTSRRQQASTHINEITD